MGLVQYGRGLPIRLRVSVRSARSSNASRLSDPIRDVIAEITSQDKKFIFFVDDNLVSDHEAAKAFDACVDTAQDPMGLPGIH